VVDANNRKFFTERTVERFKDTAIVCWALIGLIGLGYLVWRGVAEISVILRPFFFALVIAFLLKPILEFLENRGMNRTVALALSYVVFFAALGIVIGFLIPIISNEISGLVKAFPNYSRDISDTFTYYQMRLAAFRLPDQATSALNSALNSAQSSTYNVLRKAPSYTMSVLSLVLDFFLSPLIAFFILKDRASISRGFFRIVPEPWRPEAKYLAYRINIVIQGVFRVMLMLALVVSILASIGLFITGIPYALLLGFICGILQVIPYIGPVVGIVPAVIVAFVVKGGWFALGIGIYFTVLTQVASLVLTPVMMKDRVGVPPILVIFILLLFGSLFGFWGVVLAVPAAAIINELAIFTLMTEIERHEAILAEGIPVD
jgi:predicted PurR-regulated permease PerM